MKIDYSYRESPSYLPFYKDWGGDTAHVFLCLDSERQEVFVRVAHELIAEPFDLEIPWSPLLSKEDWDTLFSDRHFQMLLRLGLKGDHSALEELESIGSSSKWKAGWKWSQDVEEYLDGMEFPLLTWDTIDAEAERVQQLWFQHRLILDPSSLSYYLEDLIEDLA